MMYNSGAQPLMIKETSVNIDSARETPALHSVNRPITYLVWENGKEYYHLKK